MNAKLKTDALDLTSLLNGLVFFSPVSLLVRTTAGISLSQFFILQAIMATMVLLTEIPRNRQISRRMDTHGIIVVERFATFHYY